MEDKLSVIFVILVLISIPCFTISVILLMLFAKFSFDKAKNRIDYKTGFSSAEINFFEHMIPVMVSNRYRSKKKRMLNK